MNIRYQYFQNKNSRLESVDFLRGVAASAVMLFHYTAVTSVQFESENLLRTIGGYGHFGVEIFFVISGFIIPFSMYASSYKVNLYGRFFLRRTIRIELPYLALIVLEILAIYLSSLTPWRDEPSERLESFNFFLHLGYLNGIVGEPWLIPVFWTLAIEFQFYLLIALIFPLFLSARISHRFIILACFILLNLLFPQPELFFHHSLYFLLGILTFQLLVGVIKINEFLAAISIVMVVMYTQVEPFSILIIMATIATILFFDWNSKWAGFLGMISYSLYLVHVPFGGRLLALTQIYVHSDWVKTVLILMYLPCTFFVAWLFYVVIEKPSLFLSKRIVYRSVKLKP